MTQRKRSWCSQLRRERKRGNVKKYTKKRKCYQELEERSGRYFFKRRIVNSQEPLQKRKQRGE